MQGATTAVVAGANEMLDRADERMFALRMHPPWVVYAMLIGFALLSAVLAGRGLALEKRRHALHPSVYALVLAGLVFVIIDFEFPRLGLIRVDSSDIVLLDLKRAMH
jgi:hypothetical protein